MHFAFLVRHPEERPAQTFLLPCPGVAGQAACGGCGLLPQSLMCLLSMPKPLSPFLSAPLLKGFLLASMVAFVLCFIPPAFTRQPPLEG